jgi:L-ascorbate metabolism protein UlaG (beta-lactamase superfamily)
MKIRWFGQSAFQFSGEDRSVFIDPFGAIGGSFQFGGRSFQFDYEPITDIRADLLLVTHEHGDHNAVEVIGGEPTVIRSSVGTFDSPVGQVVGIASEHDEFAGTQRGANVLYRFTLDGVEVAHLGDLGQSELRAEQLQALGSPDLLVLPVGGGPTIGAEQAAAIVTKLAPRWVLPMHYRTAAINFLETADAFLESFEHVETLESSEFALAAMADGGDSPKVIVPAVPLGA